MKRRITFITLILVSLVFISSGNQTFAASGISLTMSNAMPAQVTTHKIGFTPSDTTDLVKTITLQYSTSLTSVSVPSGLSMSATPTVTVSNNGSNLPNSATYSAGLVTITLTSATALIASGSGVTLSIATVTNPSAGAFYIAVTALQTNGTSVTDSGNTEAIITNGVSMTGSVIPQLSFTVSGVAQSVSNLGAMNTTTVTSTASSIAYGNFINVASGPNVAAQQIQTATNATSGYSVTLQETAPLTSGANTIPNLSSASTWTNTSTTGFGVNVVNGTNGDTNSTVFSSNSLFSPIPINANTLVLASKTSGTVGVGDTENVLFQVGISSSQPSGNYVTTIDYTAIPSF